MTSDISWETSEQDDRWETSLKVSKGDGGTCQPRVLYLENLTFKNEVGRLVQIYKSRKNFTTADLQEMFMEIHLIEGR